jgi:ubiquinone/menaquinone biosynthesis C-methylase UbiE
MEKNNTVSWDPIWEKVFSEQPWGKYPGESLIRFVARNFYKLNRSEVKILEVGFGTGANIWYLAKENFDAYGIEGSETGLKLAYERLNEEGLKANLIVGDIINLPYEDNFFDAVIDNECIYSNNLANSQIMFSEISRVLKPNGKFYSRTFSTDQFIGIDIEVLGKNEYTNIKTGSLAGKGFVRLTDKKDVADIYQNHFKLISVDELVATSDNEAVKTSELIIIAEKK